ncbi:MAG: aspartate aminotransferase family protein [Candidatus Binatia bacterium]
MFRRKPRSAHEAALLQKVKDYLPSGVRNATASPAHAMVIKRGRGARIEDFSGNEYIDYLLGSGPMLLGHAHPAVVAAVREYLERGSTYLMVNEPAILLAEEIVKAVPCAEKVSFNSTGSESTFFAMRLARAYRKRDKILKFEGAYHGMSDYALMSTHWTRAPRDYPVPVPDSAGIPRSIESTMLIAPFNDIETTAAIIDKHHNELAGVIVEPMQRTIPPKPAFLQGLREITTRYGIPLIFDEIVTGFRFAYGGAQEYYGVVPDLCALGKSMSGGHPLTVLCGREEIMSYVDLARMAGGDHVRQTGTMSGNPISAVASLATLKELRREGAYERLFATGRKLKDALQRLLTEAAIPAQVIGEPPAFEVWFTDHEITDFRSSLAADAALRERFVQLLLDRGIVKAHEKFFVSLAHTDEDVEITIEAFRSAIGELRKSV